MLLVRSECTLRVPSILTITIIDNRELRMVLNALAHSPRFDETENSLSGLAIERKVRTPPQDPITNEYLPLRNGEIPLYICSIPRLIPKSGVPLEAPKVIVDRVLTPC